MPGLTADPFQRWLRLFRDNADAQPNRAMAAQACLMAERIAPSLWLGYQVRRDPDVLPTALETRPGH